MKTFTLLLAFAALYVASSDAGIIKRQAEKRGRLVRVRGRQREDRQLFLEPLPLAAAPGPFLIPSVAPLPQAVQPIQVVELRAQEPAPAPTNYGGPVVEVAPQPEAAPLPEEVAVFEVRDQPEEAPANYGSPIVEVPETRASYDAPQPAAATLVEVREQPAVYTVPQTIAAERIIPVNPIAITRSVYNAPGARAGNDNWDYAFEGENGIKQEATGVLRSVGGSDVIVMKGSYEYIGADNQVYVVEWEADENGFRADAPHLPKSVPIPFPEQQAAVDAQIRFAAEEDELNLRAAASNALPTYAAAALPVYNN